LWIKDRKPKLTKHQAREALKRVAAGETLREIALSYNVEHSEKTAKFSPNSINRLGRVSECRRECAEPALPHYDSRGFSRHSERSKFESFDWQRQMIFWDLDGCRPTKPEWQYHSTSESGRCCRKSLEVGTEQ
jgi:hypothetical protein